ncbi:uncharacterized protein LOC131225960 isoform X1 [Magnolia sinica]|uniref:uncharacterized protein LOC131225960 isoform X1 n=1 Tax=Magnolia sinica TaxID=86752 RepID=UPI002658592A|nr:uncharacterized protein LOC131225960 isoform X1 [Magnolia sinica]
MKARLVVFPIKGRNWCFSKSACPSVPCSEPAIPSTTLKDLWRKISADRRSMPENAEIVVDFVSDKMNRAWINLEKAPDGTFKNKIYGLGSRLLATVKPSEIFLKSISKETTNVEINYPASVNPRLVRRRLRHIAMRGSIIHKRYFYGSLTLLPITAGFAVLPLPNVPFFWILFRAYSNWKAFQGSERLLLLVSDCSKAWTSLVADESGTTTAGDSYKQAANSLPGPPWVLQPSEELGKLLSRQDVKDNLSTSVVLDICKEYALDNKHVLKYRDSV